MDSSEADSALEIVRNAKTAALNIEYIPLERHLKDAVNALNRQNEVERQTCCLRGNKTSSPKGLKKAIVKELDDGLTKFQQYLNEMMTMQMIKQEEGNRHKSPFSFSQDAKYVPIEETLEKIRRALENVGSRNNVVLLFGASGTGKSTLAKYLALDYSQKSEGVSSSSSVCKFSDGVLFVFCGRNADSLSIIKRLFKDLGYNLDESTRGDGSLDHWKSMLMEKLRNGKSVLIILDDVWDQKLLVDVVLNLEGVNYLITSQEKLSWSEITEHVGIGDPSLGEARQILANHIVGWDYKLFPIEVQEEVDGLIEDVRKHPLVLANLATLIRCEEVANFRRWTLLREELKNAILAADRSICRPIAYGKPYGPLISSLTMATDFIPETALSLLLLLSISSGDGVDVNILRFWFNLIHGESCLKYSDAFEDLVKRSLMSVKGTEVSWGDEPWKVCLTHDLLRKLIQESKGKEVAEVLRKLIERKRAGDVASDQNEEDLAAALVFVYGDMRYRDEARTRVQIHKGIQGSDSWESSLKFMKTFARLLHPRQDEAYDWEKRAHVLAKTVIFHFLRFLELKDEAISDLLGIREAFEVTCVALQCSPPGLKASSIPRTIRSLVTKLSNLIPLNFQSYGLRRFREVGGCLEVLYHIEDYSGFILQNKPEVLIVLTKLLRSLREHRISSSSTEIVTVEFPSGLHDVQRVVMKLLLYYSEGGQETRMKVATAPGMLETLLSLLDANLHSSYEFDPPLLEQSADVFLQLACGDVVIKARTILLPDVLETLVSLLSITPKPALQALEELAWKSVDAERIASCPGVLNELAKLLSDYSDVQSNAVRCLGRISSFRNGRTIIASTCMHAFRTLIELLHQDSPPDLLVYIAMAVRKIVSEEIDFFLESSRSFLTEVLQRLDLLLDDNPGMSVRGRAVHALEILASEEAICKRLDAHPGLLEQIITIPPHPEVEYLTHVNSAVKRIFIEGEGLEEARRKTLVILSVKMYTDLLQSLEVRSEITPMVAEGLGNISRRQEFRKVVTDAGAEKIIVKQMKIDPTFYKSEAGAHVVEDILFGGTNLTQPERKVLVAEVLDFYMRSLRDDFRIQENSIRTIASLAYWEEIRKVLIEGRRIEKLLDHVRSSPSAVSLECVAKIIYRVCCMEWDEVRRSMILEMTLERYAALLGDGMQSDVEESTTVGMAILTSRKEDRTMILEDEKKIDLLLGLLEVHATRKTFNMVVYLLQNILVTGSGMEVMKRIAFMERVRRSLAALLSDGIHITVQADAIEAFGRFAFSHEIGECRVVYARAVNELASCLRKVEFRAMLKGVCEVVELASASESDSEDLQRYALQGYVSILEDDINESQHGEAAHCLARLLCYETNRKILKSACPHGQTCLRGIVHRGYSRAVQWAATALTLLDLNEAEENANLSSLDALRGESQALVYLQRYHSALDLFDRAIEWAPRDTLLLRERGFVRGQLGDFMGALEDLNQAASMERSQKTGFIVRERGILKSNIQDYNGALLDLNDALRIDPDDYEILKHRGLTKFLLGDEDGARFDAEQALSVKFTVVGYSLLAASTCWGASSVKYLGFDL